MLWVGPVLDRPAGERQVVAGAMGPRVKDVPLARVATAGAAQTSGTVIAKIRNPSRKLGCGFQVHFEAASRIAVNAFDGSPANLWTTRVYDPEGDHLLHFLQEAMTIPRQYEMETFAPGVQLSIVLGLPRDAGGNTIAGNWILRVRWEPVIPMCDDEARALGAAAEAWLEVGLANPLAP